MPMDLPTLVTVAAITSALLALSVAVTLRGQPHQLRDSLHAWTIGIAIQALGWLLIAFRGSLSETLTVVLPNLAIALGYAVCIHALRLFGALRGPPRSAYALAAAVLLVSIVFTNLAPSRHWRMVFNSALLGAIFAEAALTAYRLRVRGEPRPPSHWLLIAVFGLGAVMLGARAVLVAIEGPQPAGGVLALGPVTTVLYASTAFGPVLATFAFVLMCNEWLNRELMQLATFDSLTGVYNRRSLERLATEAFSRAQRHGDAISVSLVDVDHFKRINDAFGHEAGDLALRSLADCMQQYVGAGHTIGRVGGEEFVVLMPGADEGAGVTAAEGLRQRVEALLNGPSGHPPLRVSVGVAAAEGSQDSYAQVLRRADHALYAAKRDGRNRVMASSSVPSIALAG